MSNAPSVLLAVATELANTAKESLPKMRVGESILQEWYDNGIYYRETMLNGELFRSQYDFKQRKSRRMAVVK